MVEVIVIDGDLEGKIKLFRRLVETDMIFRELKLRNTYPNLTDRAKVKERFAITRRRRTEKKRAYYERRTG